MSIAPIVKSVTIKATPSRCFELFTSRMGDWWTKGTTIGRGHHKALVVEPKVGGRWYEVDSEDKVLQWGEVDAWEPPHRLLLAWRLGPSFAYDPNFRTDVEITFKDAGAGQTLVTLEHRNLERFGQDAEKIRAMLERGWIGHMEKVATFIESEK